MNQRHFFQLSTRIKLGFFIKKKKNAVSADKDYGDKCTHLQHIDTPCTHLQHIDTHACHL